jgi:glucan phosphoethanolaminetransferase (alkaline phosphatase superfamily)
MNLRFSAASTFAAVVTLAVGNAQAQTSPARGAAFFTLQEFLWAVLAGMLLAMAGCVVEAGLKKLVGSRRRSQS